MTLRLILTRHAKSDWDDPLASDHSRPLNARGRGAAPRIGMWLAQHGFIPGEALVSDARRTRETWALLSEHLPATMLTRQESALYLASPDTMLRMLQSAQAACVIMIGHNPGIADLARMLLAQAPDHPQFSRYPTCATLVADFDRPDWKSVGYGAGHALGFVVPRDLNETPAP